MQNVQMTWSLQEAQDMTIEKHCSNCGKTVQFTDTMIRRHNANGKNIYRFAIYKCEKNHTWNKKLEIYQAYTGHARVVEEEKEATNEVCKIPIEEYADKGIEQVQIELSEVEGNFRIDKTIAKQIDEWSRTEINKRIQEGTIQINNRPIKPSTKLKTTDQILIML
ncbi:S4 domain-containing protein [Pseudalkalibacillus sp. Hm43]|uniref:S4 domain-containing protein n=1 Tax=Pseudalkalibacillus sp. Hm43 TaxID=3450742 RepID=UPI003F443332